MIEKNAKIHSTMLGIEDHGIMSCWINLDYDSSSGQSFGGYSLDGGGGTKGHAKSILALRKILTTVGVEKWEDLKGKYVRIRKEKEYGSMIHSIGHIIEDKWFSFEEHFSDK